MPSEQGTQGIEELTAWLEADDAQGRPTRAQRLRDLLGMLPAPLERLTLMGGEESVICFDEIRRCYLDGSYVAVVLLCLAYVERELAARLYGSGWNPAKSAKLSTLLEKGYEHGVLSDLEWQTYRELASLRNSHAHFRAPGNPTSLLRRVVDENALGTVILEKDARRAVATVAGLVKHQSDMHVELSHLKE